MPSSEICGPSWDELARRAVGRLPVSQKKRISIQVLRSSGSTKLVLIMGITEHLKARMAWIRLSPGASPSSIVLLLCILSAAMGRDSLAQSPDASVNSARYKLHGVVVNAVTGDPVPYSLVQITNAASHGVVFTDLGGRFELQDLAPGPLVLETVKPGFQAGTGGSKRKSLTLPVPDSVPLEIRLLPDALITGHVTDEQGEPVEGAAVKVSRSGFVGGRKSRIEMPAAVTDDQGNFRVASLKPGLYHVVVHPEPDGFTESGLAYSGFYYADGADQSGASPQEVKAGEHIDLHFTLKRRPAFQVSGQVLGFALNHNLRVAVVNSQGDAFQPQVKFNSANTTFTIRSVPAGTYVLRAFGEGNDGQMIFTDAAINVTRDLTGVLLSFVAGVSVPVTVRPESKPSPYKRGVDAPPVRMAFRPKTEGASLVTGPELTDDGKGWALKSVKPGVYSAAMRASTGYVKSAVCGNTDLLREDLIVPDGGAVPPIEITLAQDSGSLTLKLPAGTDNSAGILIVPDTSPALAEERPFQDGAELFVAGLAPGDYKVFAFASLDEVEYANPDVLARYRSNATEVTIPPNGTVTASVQLIPVEEQ